MAAVLAAGDAGRWALNWAGFYLVCFVIGFVLTLLSLLAGTFQMHLPGGWHFHFDHGVHFDHGHVHAGAGGPEVPVLNFATLVAFLAWFGGTGYLVTHYAKLEIALGFLIAVVGGITGGAIVFWFLSKLVSYDQSLRADDSDLVGVIGTVNIRIREGGTGEMVFSQGGTRRVSGARSEDGVALAKGTEVVITRYEKGIAYVKPWDEFSGELSDKSVAGDAGRGV